MVLDKEGVYEEIEKFYEQAEQGYELSKDVKIEGEINKIFVIGQGPARIAAKLIKQYLILEKIPVFTVEQSVLPGYADKNSLVLAANYAGDDDETIEAYRGAHKKRCKLVSFDDAAKLKEIALISNEAHVLLPRGIPKKMAYGSIFFSMLRVLEKNNIISNQTDFARRTIKVLKHNNFEDLTEELSNKIFGKTPIIYASKRFEAAADKWKNDFNLSAKIPAFSNTFPAAAHGEIEGFDKQSQDYHALIIGSGDDGSKVKKQISAAKEVIRKKSVPVTELSITGDCYLAKLMSACLIGDWLSYNLAIKLGVDPAKTPSIEEIKKRLKL